MSVPGTKARYRLHLVILLPAYLVFAQLCALVGGVMLAAIRLDFSGERFLGGFLAFSALATAGALARALVVAAWHRIEVGPVGIRARPRDRQPIPWAAIETVRITRWSLLSYLELEVANGRPARFPLYLTDLPGFAVAVEEFAGENHPLTWALYEWLEHEVE